MRRIVVVLLILLFGTLALITLAQDEDHDEACDVESLLERVEEYQEVLDELVTNTENDTEAILDTIAHVGHELESLASDCAYSSEIDPNSIGNPENGEILFNTMIPELGFACSTCHRVDSDETLIGPGLLNVANPDHDPADHIDTDNGEHDEHSSTGSDTADEHDEHGSTGSDTADEHDEHSSTGSDDDNTNTDAMEMDIVTYIYTSIVNPGAFVVPGFVDNLMPQTYTTVFTEAEIYDIVAYLLSLQHDVGN